MAVFLRDSLLALLTIAVIATMVLTDTSAVALVDMMEAHHVALD